MTIDWTKPVETTEDPPRPVRVLSPHGPDEHYPIVFAIEGCRGIEIAKRNGEVLGEPPMHLRNVAPPKPEPVLREAWVNCYDPKRFDPGVHPTKDAAERYARSWREACLKVAWMSDGSPVPGEDDPLRYGVCETCVEKAVKRCDELVAERDASKAELSAAIDRIQDMLAGDDGQAFQEARKWLAARGEQPKDSSDVCPTCAGRRVGPGDCPHCRNGVRHTALGALMTCPYCGGSSAGEQLCVHCGTPVFGPGFCPQCDGTGKKETK
jgi:hypothetical protein